MNSNSNGLQLPYKYSRIIQERLQKKGISVSQSLIYKVRVKTRENMEIMKELRELSNEYKELVNHS